ncbi:hypothetical protein [Pseudomonas sp. NBRC 111137]|nr:hypothetical protein [Pseudomonas sp. NBRC 111137]
MLRILSLADDLILPQPKQGIYCFQQNQPKAADHIQQKSTQPASSHGA